MESNVFVMTNVQEHAARRRLLARPFSRTSLLTNFQELVTERAKLAVQRIKQEAASNGVCDVMKWWTLMTSDVIMEVAFGEKAGLIEAGEVSLSILTQPSILIYSYHPSDETWILTAHLQKNAYIHDLEQAEISFALQGEFPRLYKLLKTISPKTYGPIEQSLTNVIAKANASAQKAKEGKLTRHNILSGMIESSRQEGTIVTDFALGSQASALIIAGAGTTTTTLTYATWAMLTYPDVRRKLEDEVLGLEEGFDDAILEKLPYLDAFVTEVLRLYGSAPGALPRTTPLHGIRVGEYEIPPGVTLTTQAYTMHRDPMVFKDPERYVFPNHPVQFTCAVSFLCQDTNRCCVSLGSIRIGSITKA